jgi:hypothetical protein
MKEKIEACFNRLQGLDIKPTLTNMETLVQTMYDLRDVYNELERMERDGRAAANTEGREDN